MQTSDYIQLIFERTIKDFKDHLLGKLAKLAGGAVIGLGGGTFPAWVGMGLEPGWMVAGALGGVVLGFISLLPKTAAKIYEEQQDEIQRLTEKTSNEAFQAIIRRHNANINVIERCAKLYGIQGGLSFYEALHRGKDKEREGALRMIELAQEGSQFKFDPIEVLAIEAQGLSRESIVGTLYADLLPETPAQQTARNP